MLVHRLTDVPSAADYARGLSALRSRMHADQIHLLQTHYGAPGRTVTATRLARLAGIGGGHPVVNAHYGRLGRWFCEATGFDPEVRPDGTFRWWAMWSQGWSTSEGFVWDMLPQVAEALELLAWVAAEGHALPEEVRAGTRYVEGSVCRVTVNAYERSAAARAAYIEHHGVKCVLCGFDFAAVYGDLAEGFAHVHHLKPVSEVGESYEVDPVQDLRPVCANCHAVIHLGGGSRTIEQVKQLMAAATSARHAGSGTGRVETSAL